MFLPFWLFLIVFVGIFSLFLHFRLQNSHHPLLPLFSFFVLFFEFSSFLLKKCLSVRWDLPIRVCKEIKSKLTSKGWLQKWFKEQWPCFIPNWYGVETSQEKCSPFSNTVLFFDIAYDFCITYLYCQRQNRLITLLLLTHPFLWQISFEKKSSGFFRCDWSPGIFCPLKVKINSR